MNLDGRLLIHVVAFWKVCYDVGALHFSPEESFIYTITRRIYGLWASGID
jgi:hypothetical protein